MSDTTPISASQWSEYQSYREFGPPETVGKRLRDAQKAKDEAAASRKEVDGLKAENEALKAKLPGEGTEVLSGDEAAAYKAVKAAGLTLKDVDAGLKERDELKAKDSKRTREDSLREAMKGEGWETDDVGTISLLLGEATLEVREVEVEVTANGKTEKQKRKRGFVKTDAGEKLLPDLVKERSPLVAQALEGAASKGGSNGTAGWRETPEQRGSGKPAVKTDDDFRKATESTASYTL